MVRAMGRKSSGRIPDAGVIILVIVAALLFPHVRDAAARAGRVVREVNALWAQYCALTAENQRLRVLAQLVKSERGRELLVRGRCGYLPEGAILVVIRQQQPPAKPAPRGLRAFFNRLRARATETRNLLVQAFWLLKRARNPQFLADDTHLQ